jgi:membrane-associated protease RseP (regulator of RpoE activity)
MNRRKCRSIAIGTAVVGILSFLASPIAHAQQPPDAQAPPRATTRTPPPNPEPPRAGAVAGATAAEPGYLGVVFDDEQEKGAGVRVLEVESGGPAEQGGLKANDLITRINDTPIHVQSDMGPVLQRLAPGSKVKFVVDRGGHEQTINVALGTRPPVAQRRFEQFGPIPEPLPQPNAGGGIGPDISGAEPGRIPADAAPNGAPLSNPRAGNFPPNALPDQFPPDGAVRLGTRNLPGTEPSRRPLLGVRTRPVTDEARHRLRLPSANGALVVSRTLGSPAAQAGIPLDAVITAVDGKPINSPLDLTQLVAQAGPGREIEITYFYGGSEQRVKVKLAEFAAGSGLLGGGSASAGALPIAPAPQAGRLPMPSDKTRIEALEHRVQQLEHRVDDLEQALHKSN